MDDFNREVYDIVREIPSGMVITYGLLARLIGKPKHSRKVGKALANAPQSSGLPCHRVVNSQGRTAPGWSEQRILLEKEGVTFKKNGCIDLNKYLWDEIKHIL